MSPESPRFLEWDSQFFGVRIASLQGTAIEAGPMEHALEWCLEQRIDCLYLRSDADDVVTLRSAGAHGFRFVDVRMTLDLELAAPARAGAMPEHAAIRVARPGDTAALRAIAAYNHANTRFYADGRFARFRRQRGTAQEPVVPDRGRTESWQGHEPSARTS